MRRCKEGNGVESVWVSELDQAHSGVFIRQWRMGIDPSIEQTAEEGRLLLPVHAGALQAPFEFSCTDLRHIKDVAPRS